MEESTALNSSTPPKGEWDRAWGAVPTPGFLVDFMVSLAKPTKKSCKVLEPACGICPFLDKFSKEYGSHHEFVGVDIRPEAIAEAKQKVPFATLIEADFLLWEGTKRFDIIIGNPPYGIIGEGSHYPIYVLKERKNLYKHRFRTWYGKYNIYGAFIEQATNLLSPDGKLVFIVPGSWLVLEDFSKLRLFLSEVGRLSLYYVGKVFRGRSVSCVVMTLEKGGTGISLYEGDKLVFQRARYRGEVIRFDDGSLHAMEREGIPLGDLFDIRFAARSPEILAHPQVRSFPESGLVPVLTGRNLKAGWIDYERCYSGLWMPKEAGASLRLFYSFPHIVVGHTKGTQVVAALDERCYPWREEFHLIPRVNTLDLQAIIQYLNSQIVQNYVRTLYRDLVPHLTLPMLRNLPIPPSLGKTGITPNLLPEEWSR